MKKGFLVLMVCCLAVFAQAQKRSSNNKVSVNFGAEAGFASGNFNVTHSIGIGATAQLHYNYEENIDFLVQGGIMSFSGRKLVGTNTKVKGVALIPIMAGGRYFFSDNFFGQATLGLGIFSGGGIASSQFSYSPGLGFKINEKLDALVKYTGFTNVGGAFGVRVGYTL
jgi:hypothetical protein